MWPTLVELNLPAGTLPIHTYGLLVLSAVVAGILLAQERARQVGIRTESLMLLAAVAAFGGFPAAKLLYAVSAGDLGAVFSMRGGFAYYGGVIGGSAAVIIGGRLLGVHGWKLLDAAAPALALGNGIGRLGCVAAGCCHGLPVPHPDPRHGVLPEGLANGQLWTHPHFPWFSLEFHAGSVASIQHTPLLPTQVWMSLGSFAVCGLLLWVSGRRRFDGQVAATFLLVEPVVRIAAELFRADLRGVWLGVRVEDPPAWARGIIAGSADGATLGLTTSQGIGLAMIAAGAVVWYTRRHAGVDPETPVDDESEF